MRVKFSHLSINIFFISHICKDRRKKRELVQCSNKLHSIRRQPRRFQICCFSPNLNQKNRWFIRSWQCHGYYSIWTLKKKSTYCLVLNEIKFMVSLTGFYCALNDNFSILECFLNELFRFFITELPIIQCFMMTCITFFNVSHDLWIISIH